MAETTATIRAAREALGLSRPEAAKLLGVTTRALRYWEAGERQPPEPVRRLLWLCQRPSIRTALSRIASR
jgi:DNA-binding transcriptional regulator YiaG